MFLMSSLILSVSFLQIESAFLSVENIQPYIHFSEHHGKLFYVQQQEEVLYLKSLNGENQSHSYGSINVDPDINLHNYHISIGNTRAMVKSESQIRQEHNRLEFLSLEGNQEQEKINVQAPYIRNGLYHLKNDSTLYVVERSDSLYMARILHVEDEFQTVTKEYSLFPHTEYPQWNNTIENDLLKYKMKAVSDRKGNTCSVYMYSSWLLCSRKDGTELFATDQPDGINFPDVPPFMRGGAEFRSAPDAEDHRVQSIDVAMDDNYIYLLVFGEDVSRRMLLRAVFSGQKIDLDKYTSTTDRVYLYDKSTGSFLREIQLPNKARAITVDHKNLIVVEDGEPSGIRWIPKSKYNL